MTTNAVICELNPMHRGHKYIFESAKDGSGADSVNIAVMSGNFTQRATPAIFDKYTRAKAAVRCGADIVVELPFPWCSSGVESFALGGTAVVAGLCAEGLVFGSESGELDLLNRVANVKSSPEYREAIVKAESESPRLGNAVVFDEVMKSFGIPESLGANDKLGAEYIRFGREQGVSEFRPIPRLSEMKSATELREIIFTLGVDACREYIPAEAYETFVISEACPEELYNELLFTYCRLAWHRADSDILSYAAKVARASSNAQELIPSLPTKKYTTARLRREILFSIIGASETKIAPAFTVLLAMNDKGRAYLSENKKRFSIPVITKPADTDSLDETGRAQYAAHLKADEIYALCTGKSADEYIKKHPHLI